MIRVPVPATLVALALVLATPLVVHAQQPARPGVAPQAAVLSPAERDAAVAATLTRLETSYVFPDKVPAIVAAIDQAKAAGRYDTTDAAVLAERLSEDLRRASGDGHLYISYSPSQYAAARRSADGPSEGEDLAAFYRAEALRDHHGLSDMRILGGNVRYLRITGFQWIDDQTGAAYDAAMTFLKDGDAVIVDIRGNGGGSHSAVRYLVSHFVDPATPLLTFLEAGKPPEQSRALDHLPAGRLKGKPLYVLIDGRSASAAEDLAYAVQQFRLGELVGGTTAGAANNNALFPIDPGFMLSVSTGRPEHPVSGSNWEGKGVAPSVPATLSQSLDVAHALALQRLAAAPAATSAQRAEYDWTRIELGARLTPPTVPDARLRRLAGRYGAEAKVELRDQALWYAPRPTAEARRLTPLSADGLFAIEGNDLVRARFTPDSLETLRRGDPNPRRLPKRPG